MKIALSMIVKGTGEDAKRLERALKSVYNHVDDVFVTLTAPKSELKDVEKVCKTYKVHVSYNRALYKATQEMVNWTKEFLGSEGEAKTGDEIFLFDEARNYNFSQISKDYDWILWMDCDDVLLGGENLKTIAQRGLDEGVEAFYFNYLYQVELGQDGSVKNVLIQHLRERLVRNIGVYKWIAPIHETLIEQRPTRKIDTDACEVLHLAEIKDREQSLVRNLKNLELSIFQTQGKDPRPVYYLAKAYFDLKSDKYDEMAKVLISKYLEGEHRSGWPEERAQAWEYLAEIYRRHSEHNNAIKACMNALIEAPENPSIMVNIALSYMHKKEWERALWWARQASTIEGKKNTLVSNPKDIQARTLEILYNCSLNLGQIDNAWGAMMKLGELFPEDTGVATALQAVNALRTERDLTNLINRLVNHLRMTGEGHKIKPLLHALPRMVEDNPFMISLYNQHNPPKIWGEKEVAIYCGPGFTTWSPQRMRDPQGSFVGGSEEAVILIAEALSRQGWKVTVYNDPGSDEGEINGVQWLPYYKFNRVDHFNILIAWRDIRFFDSEFKAKKKYLWCHDIQNPIEYTKERLERITKVFFLSEWHRENVSELPKEKVLLTTNGIEV